MITSGVGFIELGSVAVARLTDLRDLDIVGMRDDAKGIQQPHHDTNHDDGVKNFFDLAVHRDVGIDQPEQHADDDQSYDKGYQ